MQPKQLSKIHFISWRKRVEKTEREKSAKLRRGKTANARDGNSAGIHFSTAFSIVTLCGGNASPTNPSPCYTFSTSATESAAG